MKIFGSLTELVSLIFRKNSQAITLRPNNATTYTASRTVDLPAQDAASTLVSRDSTDTLTNKTISGASNTISNVSLTTGVTGILPTANGGTNQNSTATFPTSGVVVTEAGTETLTNKSMSGSSNTFTAIPAGTALSGQVPTANGGTGQNSTATFPTSGVVVTEAATETLTNKTISGASNTITNVSLTAGVTGILPTANGGTNQNSTATFPTSGVVVTEAATETLTNKTMGSTNTLTGATMSSITNGGTVNIPSGADTLVARTSTDALTNKDIDGGTATNSSRITVPKAATATLAALTRKAGTVVFDTTTLALKYDDGTNLNALASATFTAPTVQKFTSGSGTYTTPAGVKYIRVIAAGGGGGGAGGGTFAGGGGGSGSNGGNTTFGSSLIAANAGGAGSATGGTGVGGTASLGAAIGQAYSGGDGGPSILFQSATTGANGNIAAFSGGSNPLGGAGTGGSAGSGASPQAGKANTGAGGGGGSCSTAPNVLTYMGGAGGAGGYVNAFITSPSATYAYSVGAAGGAGTAGTGGQAGAAGAAGIVVVEEFSS